MWVVLEEDLCVCCGVCAAIPLLRESIRRAMVALIGYTRFRRRQLQATRPRKLEATTVLRGSWSKPATPCTS
jgi:hypothetical protein